MSVPTRPARLIRPLGSLVLAATVLAACSGGGSASPSPSPGATPTPAPTTGAGAVLVTIEVSGERYRIRLTDPADIAIARTLLAGGEAPGIPNGRIVRGEPDVNEGFGWHIDPDDFEWADMTTEVCDGRPSFVEDGSLTGDRFCPWSATVVAVEAAS